MGKASKIGEVGNIGNVSKRSYVAVTNTAIWLAASQTEELRSLKMPS